MNENDNGLAADDDTALFSATVSGDTPIPEAPIEEAPPSLEAPVVAEAPTTPPADTDQQRHEPAIPPARLREEADARRAAERERDELRGRLAAYESQQRQPAPQPAQQQQPNEFWDDPDGFVGAKLTPIQQEMVEMRAMLSHTRAVSEFGHEAVVAAHTAMKQAIEQGALDGAAVNARLQASRDSVGDIVRWHQGQKARENMQRIGGDPDAWLAAELEKRMSDPTFQAQVIERARGTAQPAVTAPSRSEVPAIPSLRNIGTAASAASAANDQSDAELFSATTRRGGRG
ncbi:hypothetical protein PRN20_18200 [Devosia sp. ZB163]|uniref:hypothetical protein n=1 Tax=Devosia sp. ZB163 TaxID=3025938 RepID=UPI002362F0C9|nr:hypothetical protein [Devosia sp. ZB163]MDC9825670.1 hypothetical protein [Devosia sp. ZB163]